MAKSTCITSRYHLFPSGSTRKPCKAEFTTGDEGSNRLKLDKTVWLFSIQAEILLKSVLNYVTQGKCHCSCKNLLCQQMSGQIILQDKQALCHPRFQKAKLPPPCQEAASISESIYIKLLLRKSKRCSGSMTATLLATSGSLSSWRHEILWFSTTLKCNYFKFFQVWIGCLKVLEAIAYCANEKSLSHTPGSVCTLLVFPAS